MKFSEFFNEAVVFSSFWKDGTIIVHKDGEKITFVVDAIYHGEIKRLSSKEPEKALDKLYSWVEKGWASKI